jgi:hypothetical protein
MDVRKLGLALAATGLTLAGCSTSPPPEPHPTPATEPVDGRASFVGTWDLDGTTSISLRKDGSFQHLDCNTTGGTWVLDKSLRKITLDYNLGTALGCASSEFQQAGIGFLRGRNLILENTSPEAMTLHQKFELVPRPHD